MIEEPLSAIDIRVDEDAAEAAATKAYDIDTYMRAGRTCEGIVRALGQALGTAPHELPPLYTAVDCDALEHLFYPRPNGCTRPDVSLTFTYVGCTVSITADGSLVIQA